MNLWRLKAVCYLRGDAADIETSPAECGIFLDTHCLSKNNKFRDRGFIIHQKLPLVTICGICLDSRISVGQVGYLEAELCSFDCSDIASWTGAHHCDVCINCREATQQLLA